MKQKIIAVTGSTRGKNTASEEIVNYIFSELDKKNWIMQKYRAHEIFNKKKKLDNFIKSVNDADCLFFSTPIYVHSLPYPLTDSLNGRNGR